MKGAARVDDADEGVRRFGGSTDAIDGETGSFALDADDLDGPDARRRRDQQEVDVDIAQQQLHRDEEDLEGKNRDPFGEAKKKRKRKKRDEKRKKKGDLIVELYADGMAKSGHGESRKHLFEDDEMVEPGDPSLTDPDEIRRVLGTPAGYAKHVMILAEAFRRITGATRKEAIDYLATMFVATAEPTFGYLSLKEFGPSTGIVDVYPLEVLERLLERYPGVLPKVGFGKLFVETGTRPDPLRTDTETPLILVYPASLRIRGFALRGGGRPGYMFSPADAEGEYELRIQSPGRYEILVSATNRSGSTVIDRVDVAVRPAGEDALSRERPEPYPPRDSEKVAAWPTPAAPRLSPGDLLGAAAPSDPGAGLLSPAQLAHLKAMDAVGPDEDEAGFDGIFVDEDSTHALDIDERDAVLATPLPEAAAARAPPVRPTAETGEESASKVPTAAKSRDAYDPIDSEAADEPTRALEIDRQQERTVAVEPPQSRHSAGAAEPRKRREPARRRDTEASAPRRAPRLRRGSAAADALAKEGSDAMVQNMPVVHPDADHDEVLSDDDAAALEEVVAAFAGTGQRPEPTNAPGARAPEPAEPLKTPHRRPKRLMSDARIQTERPTEAKAKTASRPSEAIEPVVAPPAPWSSLGAAPMQTDLDHLEAPTQAISAGDLPEPPPQPRLPAEASDFTGPLPPTAELPPALDHDTADLPMVFARNRTSPGTDAEAPVDALAPTGEFVGLAAEPPAQAPIRHTETTRRTGEDAESMADKTSGFVDVRPTDRTQPIQTHLVADGEEDMDDPDYDDPTLAEMLRNHLE